MLIMKIPKSKHLLAILSIIDLFLIAIIPFITHNPILLTLCILYLIAVLLSSTIKY